MIKTTKSNQNLLHSPSHLVDLNIFILQLLDRVFIYDPIFTALERENYSKFWIPIDKGK